MYASVLDCARSQIGVKENPPGSNNVKYNTWYYGHEVSGDWYPWCAVFITWCFWQTGILDRLNGISNKAGCDPYMRWAKAKSLWEQKPKVGALVLFDWDGDGSADHIGIVEAIISNSKIVTIEGNTAIGNDSNGGEVMRRTRYSSDIIGYIYVDTSAPEPKPVIPFERIAGKDRYNTAKATANKKGSFTKVVLVSGKGYADALSAAYFAKEKKAPILLVDPDHVIDIVRYIRLRPAITNIYIIGGDGAVPSSIETLLEGYHIERLAGDTRYETNIEVLKACQAPNKQLIIVSGQGYPDGLVAGMINRPTMLVNKALRSWQLEYIKEKGFTKFYVLGGTAAVSEEIETELSELGEVMRDAGDNRYQTACKVAEHFYPNATTAVLVTGKGYADGLAAANLGEYPLLYADPNATDAARAYLSYRNLKTAYVVGGTGAISDDTANWALTKL